MNYSHRELIHLLCNIGIELSAEKNIDNLLKYILKSCMSIANADAGSIYKVKNVEGNPMLEFKYTENKSVDFPFQSFLLPLNKNSIAGACAYNKKIYNFQSMDDTFKTLGIKHQKYFDESIGYCTQNMLAVPLINYEGECIGVMQLINKKNHDRQLVTAEDYEQIISFSKDDEEIIGALASQSAILIERSELYKNITLLIDSMTESLSRAIDQRDPVTGGHSQRVATYCLRLAKYVSEKRPSQYPYSEEGLRELYIAGLLHDVGKIGVPEKLLLKAHKLNESEMEAIYMRYKYMELLGKSKTPALTPPEPFSQLKEWVDRMNKANFLPDEDEQKLSDLAQIIWEDDDGSPLYFISPYELKALQIKRGNLTDEERECIQSHVLMSYELLKDICWTKDLKKVPEIAATHHEKLSGYGYPHGRKADELDTSCRIIAIADIYDALTAKDRPYKPALPIEKSLNIIQEEAERGALDPDLVVLFTEMIHSEEN